MKSGRLNISKVGQLKGVLKNTYHVPNPDISPIIGALLCQKVIKINNATGKITMLNEE